MTPSLRRYIQKLAEMKAEDQQEAQKIEVAIRRPCSNQNGIVYDSGSAYCLECKAEANSLPELRHKLVEGYMSLEELMALCR